MIKSVNLAIKSPANLLSLALLANLFINTPIVTELCPVGDIVPYKLVQRNKIRGRR